MLSDVVHVMLDYKIQFGRMRRLDENYEVAEGVCIPRNTLYLHYVDFCSRSGMQPVNAASFGKVSPTLQFSRDKEMSKRMAT